MAEVDQQPARQIIQGTSNDAPIFGVATTVNTPVAAIASPGGAVTHSSQFLDSTSLDSPALGPTISPELPHPSDTNVGSLFTPEVIDNGDHPVILGYKQYLAKAAMIITALSLVLGVTIFLVYRNSGNKAGENTNITQITGVGNLSDLGDVPSNKTLKVYVPSEFHKDVAILGQLTVKGKTVLGASLTVENEVTLNGSLTVAGDTTIAGTLTAGNLEVGNLSGSGANLDNLNASNITQGTLSDARLSQNVALLNRDNQTFTGSNTFTNSLALGANLVLQPSGIVFGNSFSQTAAGQNVSLSAGSDVITFTAGGRTFVFPAVGPASQQICTTSITCTAPGGTAVLLNPTSAQPDTLAEPSIFINDTGGGNLLHLQSGGTDRFVVANNGNTTVAGSVTGGTYNGQTISSAASFTGTLNVTTGYQIGGLAAAGSYLRGDGTNFVSSPILAADLPAGSGNYIQNGTTVQSSANFAIQSAAVGSVGAVIRGAVSQTADLLQWQNSAGITIAKTTASGDIQATSFGPMDLSGTTIIKSPVVSQTADRLRILNDSNSILFSIGSDGSIMQRSRIYFGDTNHYIGDAIGTGMQFYDVNGLNFRSALKAFNASSTALILRGAASQTADLQQWQNSAGSILARVDANGNGYFNNGSGGTGAAFVQGGNSFGAIANLGTNDNFDLNLKTNGTAKLTVLANGNVGIGTTAPSSLLDIFTNPAGSNISLPSGSYAARIFQQRGDSGTVGGLAIATRFKASSNQVLEVGSLDTTYESYFTVNGGGGVGIGTQSAVSHFEIKKSAPVFTISNTGDGSVRGFIGNTYNVMQLGWQNVGSSVRSSYFGINSSGQVGSLSSVFGSPTFRNVFDNGSGQASFSGNVGIGTSSPGAKLHVQGTDDASSAVLFAAGADTGAAGSPNMTLQVKAGSSQTANLQEWHNSGGAPLAYIKNTGAAYFPIGTAINQATSGQTGLTVGAGGDGGTLPLLVVGGPSHFANLLLIQNSAADPRLTVGAGDYTDTSGIKNFLSITPNFAPTATSTASFVGALVQPTINFSNATPGAGNVTGLLINPIYTAAPTGTRISLQVNTNNAGAIGQVIRAAASQTADLLQAQDSTGAVLAKIQANGIINGLAGVQGTALGIGVAPNAATALVNVFTGNAAYVGQIIKGAASQTADLLQIQNSASTNVLTVGHGTQPASVAGNGTAGGTILGVTGGKGGNTSGITGQTGGAGSVVTINSGAGGDAPAGSINGNGGNITVQAGAPGTGLGTAGTYGNLLLQTSGGNVGIGTTTPNAKLEVVASIATPALLIKGTGETVFNYTGASQTYVVPAGVTSLTIEARGGAGGDALAWTNDYGIGGRGARVTSTISVTPGETLTIYVGGRGNNGAMGTPGTGVGGFNGGANGGAPGDTNGQGAGGGGATDVRQLGTALANRVIIAGAGGGASPTIEGGGVGAVGGAGGQTGADGGNSANWAELKGKGATQSAGGVAAGGACSAASTAGALGVGGAGGSAVFWGNGEGGGGGGGYYGGSGGTSQNTTCNGGYYYGGGGGGGGSSYSSGTGTIYQSGVQSGNGTVIIRPQTANHSVTQSGSGATLQVIDAVGNFGIGTATPLATLHVNGLSDNNTFPGSPWNMVLSSTNGQNAGIGSGILFTGNYTGNTQTSFAAISGVKENGYEGNYAGALLFSTRVDGAELTEKMRITSTGNVGIGTTNPTTKLEITGTNPTLYVRGDGLSYYPSIIVESVTTQAKFYTYAGGAIAGAFIQSSSSSVGSKVTFGVLLGGGGIARSDDSATVALRILGSSAYNSGSTVDVLGIDDSTGTKILSVKASGALTSKSSITSFGTPDIAEYIDAATDVTVADVVMADPNNAEAVVKSNSAYSGAALGVISDGSSAFITNPYGKMDGTSTHPNAKPLVLAGRVPVKITNEGGPVAPGDYLTSSSTPGHAMKATRAGPTIGKALGFFDGTTGTVLALINLSYYDPNSSGNLQTTGDVNIGGNTTMAGSLNVSGMTTLANLTVAGNTTIQGTLIATNAVFTETLTVNGHLITGNTTGTTTIAAGAAACTTPTVSISGNDTAGTITVTTGTGCAAAGVLATISFAGAYGSAPRVIVSADDANAAALNIFTGNRTTTTFSLDTTTVPANTTTYTFNYFVAQ